MSNSRQVQYCIRRTANSHNNRYRVFESFSCQQLSRKNLFLNCTAARTSAEATALLVTSSSSAAMVEEKGSDSPIASIAADIVLAVNMPPHEPTPGQALRSIANESIVAYLAGTVLAHSFERAHNR